MNKYTAEQVDGYAKWSEGASLRDYFAARAMQGLLSAFESDDEPLVPELARIAYEVADGMLAERGRERESAELIAGAYQPQEKGATHCDNCGLTWLDDGLNPVGCPYCKGQSAQVQATASIADKLADALREAMGMNWVEGNSLGNHAPEHFKHECLELLRYHEAKKETNRHRQEGNI